jgi:hypothetical protein
MNKLQSMKKILMWTLMIGGLVLSSCIVQAPKYSPVENVMKLQLGMTQEEVSSTLKIPPYDLKTIDSSGYIMIYKYRTTDRNTVPLFMGPTNGVKARGRWVDLFITYSPEGIVTSINSCSECSETEVKEKRIDINALITLVTLTLPALLVFLKLN